MWKAMELATWQAPPGDRNRPAEAAAARERIATLGVPPQDPVGGDGLASWR